MVSKKIRAAAAAFKKYTALKTVVSRVKKEIPNATKEEERSRRTDQTHTGQSIYVKSALAPGAGLAQIEVCAVPYIYTVCIRCWRAVLVGLKYMCQQRV
jgi:hypothetical protein